MKPTTLTAGRLLLILLTVGLTIGLVSWDFKQSPGRYRQGANDTVPKVKSTDKDRKIRDLDDVLEELNAADIQINMEKVQKEIAEAMKKIDGEKIRMEIEKAMKEVDFDKIRKEIETSMSKVDFDKMKTEMAEALKEIDAAKIQQEIQGSLAKIDWDKMKVEMDEMKKIDMDKIGDEMEKVKKEMEKLGPELKKEMEKAKVEIEKAKVEMKEYKAFVDGLENDGLINKKQDYAIIHKDGELTINGKKASTDIYSKYRSFLEKHKNFTIKKENDDFNIDID